MSKILIAYYSHSGNTQKLAKLIAQKTDGTLCELEPETPYPADYNTVVEQAKKEISAGYRPALKTKVEHMEAYDTILIGTPNWWSTVAPPVAAFLERHNFAGKTIALFCSNGGGGFGHIEQDIAQLCPHSTLLEGVEVYGTSGAETKIPAWLKKIGFADK